MSIFDRLFKRRKKNAPQQAQPQPEQDTAVSLPAEDEPQEPAETPAVPMAAGETPAAEAPVDSTAEQAENEPAAAEENLPAEQAETPAETGEPAEDSETGQESDGAETAVPPAFTVRYKTSFMARLIQSEPPVQAHYTVLKNALLSYK